MKDWSTLIPPNSGATRDLSCEKKFLEKKLILKNKGYFEIPVRVPKSLIDVRSESMENSKLSTR